MAKETIYNQNHPVALAVEPLRADAVKRAREMAERLIERIRVALAEHNGNREAFAAYPSSRLSRPEYVSKRAYYYLVQELTLSTKTGSRSPHDPDPAVMSTEGMARYIKRQEEKAESDYTAFIIKLIDKVGECDSATLDGSFVWSHSIMTVKKGDVVERWKTQTIVNVSKLWTVFNQWPTRKIE